MIDNVSIKPDCPCTEECQRHGNCKACRAYHNSKSDLSYCKRINSSTIEAAMSNRGHAHGLHHGHWHKHIH